MWNGIPRVLRRQGLWAALLCTCLFALLSNLAQATPTSRLSPSHSNSNHASDQHSVAPASVTAINASCGDVVINEVLFNGDDEWVELYVVNDLDAGVVIKVSDLETTGGQFEREFTLANSVPADRYIIVHGNSALPVGSSQEPEIGFANFFDAGNGSDLANGGDNVVLSIGGTVCEEVHWGTNTSAVSSAPVTLSFGGTGSIINGESIARSPNGPSGQFVRGATDGLYNAVGGDSIGRNNVNGALPVTLSWFHATRAGESVNFAWQTATETGNAGFNLLAATADGEIVQINLELIDSTVIDSVEATDYTYSIATDADLFYVQEVGIDGEVDEIGPFAVGETYGVRVETQDFAQQTDTQSKLYLPTVQR